MARRPRNTLRLGVTVVVMFVLLVACLLFIAGSDLFRPTRKELIVRFAPGTTLPELGRGSFVTYLGQKIGAVSETRFVEMPDAGDPVAVPAQMLEVRAGVPADLDLRVDAEVFATGPPLGGKGMLEIISRGDSPTRLDPGTPLLGRARSLDAVLDRVQKELDSANPEGLVAIIKAQVKAADIATLVEKTRSALDNVEEITASLERELSDEDERLLFKMHAALDRINDGLSEIVSLVKENRPHVDQAMASVESAAGRLDKDIAAPLAGQLELDGQTVAGATLLAKAHQAFDKLNGSLADIRKTTEQTKKTVSLNADRVDEVFENAQAASVILKAGIRDLTLHPWKLLSKPSERERKELDVIAAARDFTDAAAHLDDATARLKSLIDSREGQLPADDPDLASIRLELQSAAAKFTEAEQALWEMLQR
ncbi:MAG: hypothetical protein J5J06_00455 [Phycisphaerae bacterium]|nr:hypothetical protein [Phycisphaerae bacterium]